MEKTFIDTSFVVALVNQRDQHHDRAVALSAAYDHQQFLLTDAILVEIGNALSRRFHVQAVDAIEGFLFSEDVEIVSLTPELFDQAFAMYTAHEDKEWGMTDCISFVVMREAGILDALTTDQHFVQAGFRALTQG